MTQMRMYKLAVTAVVTIAVIAGVYVLRGTAQGAPESQLLDDVAGTVGVICPPSLRDHLAERLEAAKLADAGRLAVVTSLQSKGLEYDGVLVVSPDQLVAESSGGIRALYVALTRPTQRLVTLDASPGADWRRSLG